MSNKIRKVEDLEVGKYYKSGISSFIRIDKCDEEDGTVATLVKRFDWVARIETDWLVMIDPELEEDYWIEITAKEFDEVLDEAKEQFEEMYNQLKAKNNESI